MRAVVRLAADKKGYIHENLFDEWHEDIQNAIMTYERMKGE